MEKGSTRPALPYDLDTFPVDLEGDPSEIAKERQKFAGYPSSIHARNGEALRSGEA